MQKVLFGWFFFGIAILVALALVQLPKGESQRPNHGLDMWTREDLEKWAQQLSDQREALDLIKKVQKKLPAEEKNAKVKLLTAELTLFELYNMDAEDFNAHIAGFNEYFAKGSPLTPARMLKLE